jgi:hypothetical protein
MKRAIQARCALGWADMENTCVCAAFGPCLGFVGPDAISYELRGVATTSPVLLQT